MDLFFATMNGGKIASLQHELTPLGITVVQAPIDIPEPRSSDVKEIALAKVAYAFAHLGKPVVALDAGFYIPALNGFPRAFTNFAFETIGIPGILKLVDGTDRRCEFRQCIVYEEGTGPVAFDDIIPGAIADEPRGERKPWHWSDLVTIFIPHGQAKTMAEMTNDEFAAWRATLMTTSQLFAAWYAKNKLQ